MAVDESKVKSSLGAVLTWAGGIASAVIAAVLIYHFTQVKPPVPPPTYPQFGLTGLITDSTTKQPIANAIVTASFENNIKSYTTDGSGAYAFTMDGAKGWPGRGDCGCGGQRVQLLPGERPAGHAWR
jgi:hypothetical protein